MESITIDFAEPIPLFPLPNCVLFPNVIQPLHIFEERYKAMMADTLAEQMLIAMALLQPGWKTDYHGCPAIHPIVCVGRIVAHEQLANGQYNLLLQGIVPARVREERRRSLYRVAALEPLPDLPLCQDDSRIAPLRQELERLFDAGPLADLTIAESVRELTCSHVALTPIIDLIAFTLVQEVEQKQRLLEQRDPILRGQQLVAALHELAEQLQRRHSERPSASWPPAVGVN